MNVPKRFFKFRHRFNFSPHRYEIGRPVFQNRNVEDNFFLLRIYEIDNSEFQEFYDYQLNYYLEANPHEQAFFKHVYEIVINRIKHFKRRDPFSSNYASGLEACRKLEAFRDFLSSIDCWQATSSVESVISEKDKLINDLQERIKELEEKLKESSKYDTSEKIVIKKGYLPVLIDLIQQLQNLTLPDGNKLVHNYVQSPWYKLISRYFRYSEKDISIETARNYFPARKDDKPAKFIEISEKDKLFTIIPREPKESSRRL